MRPKFWQTNEFKTLQDEWNEKLNESGFKDAETLLGDGDWALKQKATNAYRATHQTIRDGKQRYFELLGSAFNDEQFCDWVERLIMEHRADGWTIREISDKLKMLNERCHRETIRNVIRKYEVRWKIRVKR